MFSSALFCFYDLMVLPPDINECASDMLNECHEYAMCVNTTGSYDCTCIDGYEGDGFDCTGTHTISIMNSLYIHCTCECDPIQPLHMCSYLG